MITRDDPKYPSVIGESIAMAESDWTIEKATYNKHLANFNKINRGQDRKTYCKVVCRLIDRFLILNNIKWTDDQLFTASLDLMERCLTWNIADVICFMKYIRQNPKNIKEMKVYPNFAPMNLLSMVAFYNEAQVEIDEPKRRQMTLEHNAPIKALTVTTGDGKVLQSNLVVEMSKKFAKGVKPQNAVEAQQLRKDVEKLAEDASKPAWLKEKENNERKLKIAKGANDPEGWVLDAGDKK